MELSPYWESFVEAALQDIKSTEELLVYIKNAFQEIYNSGNIRLSQELAQAMLVLIEAKGV